MRSERGLPRNLREEEGDPYASRGVIHVLQGGSSKRSKDRSQSLLVRWGDAWGCYGERASAWASSGRGQLQQACGFTAV